MSVATPARRWLRGTRGRLLTVLLVCLAGVATLGASGMRGTLVYYRTPTEALAAPPAQRFRLAGLVEPGSLHRDGSTLRFVLTDGVSSVQVLDVGQTPQLLREGLGAVAEGNLDKQQVFHSDLVLVRHSNEYRPPDVPSGASAP